MKRNVRVWQMALDFWAQWQFRASATRRMISARGASLGCALTGTRQHLAARAPPATHLSPPYSRSPLSDLPVESFRFRFDPDRRKFNPFAHTNTRRYCMPTNSHLWKRRRPCCCMSWPARWILLCSGFDLRLTLVIWGFGNALGLNFHCVGGLALMVLRSAGRKFWWVFILMWCLFGFLGCSSFVGFFLDWGSLRFVNFRRRWGVSRVEFCCCFEGVGLEFQSILVSALVPQLFLPQLDVISEESGICLCLCCNDWRVLRWIVVCLIEVFRVLCSIRFRVLMWQVPLFFSCKTAGQCA